MESEKLDGTQTQPQLQSQPQQEERDFLSASSYQEQDRKLRHNTNSIGDEGRDEGEQAGDFLRGSRADEPPTALMHILHDHHHHRGLEDATMSHSKPSASAAGGAETEKSGDGVETAKGKENQHVGGDETYGKGVEEQEHSSHHMPHEEVPQPGQYTDMDAVVELVALADV
ncbi:unnamed protein product [Calypogeia fissa]